MTSLDYGLPPGVTEDCIKQRIKLVLQLPSTPELSSIKRIDENAGMVSYIFQVNFEGNLCKLYPKGVVLKLPTYKKLDSFLNPEEQKLAEMVKRIHNIECFAYRNLPNGAVGMPPCIGMEEISDANRGALMFRTFEHEVCMPDIVQGLSESQVAEIIACLARFHAHVIKQGLNSFKDYLQVGLPVMFDSFPSFLEKSLPLWPKYYTKDVSICKHPNIQALASPKRWQTLCQTTKHQNLAHGDLWCNNLLLFGASGGPKQSDRLAAILDWQGLHIGSIGEDLARLLTQNTCHTLVEKRLDFLLNHYYTELSKHCDPPFDLDFVYAEFRANFGYGALLTLFQATIWRDNIQRCIDRADEESLNIFYERIEFNLKKAVEYLEAENTKY